MRTYETHQAANLFPMMTEEEFAGLAADIRANGVKEYITLFDGKIIDGRNRYKAMLQLNIDPQEFARELEECSDPIDYVLSLNLHRRQLSTAQRAMIAAEVAIRKLGDNQHAKEGSQIKPPSQEAAAKSLGCSRSSVKLARKVLDGGAPAVVSAVKAGELAASMAAELVKFVPDHERQEEAVANGRYGIESAIRKEKFKPKGKAKKAKPKPLPPPPMPLPKLTPLTPPTPPTPPPSPPADEDLRDEANHRFLEMVKTTPEKMDLLRILFDAMDEQQRTWAGELWSEWQAQEGGEE